ncbi:hypothetical protein HU200_043698 [Digitaria exilis]|uniref:C2H2-type domain-containing protein n=1 Tax=Digitaria exilis TaxID=1010633 RepID=A0A835B2Z3_9POAL|nr:hypothetical protein HU200_043698 [Digitaria exilis]
MQNGNRAFQLQLTAMPTVDVMFFGGSLRTAPGSSLCGFLRAHSEAGEVKGVVGTVLLPKVPLLRVDLTAVFSGACGRCQERHHDLERWVAESRAPFPADQARAWSEARACDGPLLAYGARPTSLGPDKFDARPVLVEINKQRRVQLLPLPAGIDPLKTEQPPASGNHRRRYERVRTYPGRHLPTSSLRCKPQLPLPFAHSVPRHGRHSPTPRRVSAPPRPPPPPRRLTSTRRSPWRSPAASPHSPTRSLLGRCNAEAAARRRRLLLFPSAFARVRFVSDGCDKPFKSWKALFGHMRCHPERQWRGIKRPPAERDVAASLLMLAGPIPTSPPVGVGKGKKKTKSLPRDEPLQRCVVEHYHYFAASGATTTATSALGGHKRCHWEMACGERMEMQSVGDVVRSGCGGGGGGLTVRWTSTCRRGDDAIAVEQRRRRQLERVAGVEAWY